MNLREIISVDDKLRKLERDAEKCAKEVKVFNESNLDSKNVKRTLEVLIDASKAEQDRETNLNARGATVAAVAGLVVSLWSVVAKSVVPTGNGTIESDSTNIVILALFVAALFAVTMAMVMAVLGVLRPKRGHTTKNFFGQTLVNLWLAQEASQLVRADKDRMNLLFLDRCWRTLPV